MRVSSAAVWFCADVPAWHILLLLMIMGHTALIGLSAVTDVLAPSCRSPPGSGSCLICSSPTLPLQEWRWTPARQAQASWSDVPTSACCLGQGTSLQLSRITREYWSHKAIANQNSIAEFLAFDFPKVSLRLFSKSDRVWQEATGSRWWINGMYEPVWAVILLIAAHDGSSTFHSTTKINVCCIKKSQKPEKQGDGVVSIVLNSPQFNEQKKKWCDLFSWALASIFRGIMGLGETLGRRLNWYSVFLSPLLCLFIHSTCQHIQTAPFLSPFKNIMHYSIILLFLMDRQRDYNYKYSSKARGSYIHCRELSAAVFPFILQR